MVDCNLELCLNVYETWEWNFYYIYIPVFNASDYSLGLHKICILKKMN